MALPNPGVSLSLSQIQTEFGGTNPASLNEYYAGGAYVPAGTTGYYGAIPTSGNPIGIRNFYGSSSGFFVAGYDAVGVPPTQNIFVGVANGTTGAAAIGTFIQTTFTISAITYTLAGLYDIYQAALFYEYAIFAVVGNHTGSWWTNITVNGTTYSRTADFTAAGTTGTYNSGGNYTYWQTPQSSGKSFNMSNATTYGLSIS